MSKLSPQNMRTQVVPATIDEFLAQQQDLDLLRFITCGSVDDGKSTLIGRLLWDSQQLLDDQLAALRAESKKFGTQGEDIDFALLVDGLAAEREQGITIDVAYRFFSTARRKFIVADTPGHEQYTRNMVTGASTADVAILLVDARAGLMTQTRRHAFLTSLMGIRHVVLAINKMDLIAFDQRRYAEIENEFITFAKPLGFQTITTIPLSALKGDNVTERSVNTPWYKGPTLIGYLETVNTSIQKNPRFAFPIQSVSRPNSDFRGFCGTVTSGEVSVGAKIRITASGQEAVLAEIVTMDGSLERAKEGDAVVLRLDREIDASRGDVVALAEAPVEMTDQFEATIVWMHEQAGLTGRSYDLKLATQWTAASITNIKHKVDINTLAQVAAKDLQLNDIAICTLATTKPVAFDAYDSTKALGSFILVDRYTNSTVAAGMIRHTLRRSQNVQRQAMSITRPDRERLNGHAAKVIWFTGLSGSGKSTLANALEVELHSRGIRTYILDGDNVRQGLNKDLGFTDADRVENIRRVAEVARLMLDAGIVVLTAFISPFRTEREMARELIGNKSFVEVYVSTPLETCEQRDVKGLYRKARGGALPNLTGINSIYEVPKTPSIAIDTSTVSINEALGKIMMVCFD